MGQLIQAVPFAGVLFSFSILPGIASRFWHRRMAAIIGVWVVFSFASDSAASGIGPALRELWQVIFAQYLPFMSLLLALYALGGGIGIKGGPWGRPWGNLLLLALGTLLASVMGTIGAALLLIHPLLAANGHRLEKRHLVIAFIILAGNCGGALSPLGDPPLLVGFLRGVPFLWPAAHLWLPLVIIAVPVLLLCLAVDIRLAGREPAPRLQKLRIRGGINIFMLVLLIMVIPLEGVWHPGNFNILSATMPGEHFAAMLLELACIAVSEAATPRAIRRQNRFAWSAMREITVLFFGIFATIAPVFGLLEAAHLAPQPLAWFWASGIASAILDAAPTYLIFFEAAGGHAASLAAPPAKLLTAIAAGSVFFGPLTYLGNAPNLMIREIAARRGVRMPGFFAFAGIMVVILAPLYGVISLIFL